MPKPKTWTDFNAEALRISHLQSTQHRQPTVALAWCRGEDVNGWFLDSIVGILAYDTYSSDVPGRGRHILKDGGGTIVLQSGPRIAEARSQLVDQFLNQHSAEWLLMLDTDMDLPNDLVPRMLAYADLQRCPILGALCFAGQPYGRQYPTVYRAYNEESGHLAVEPIEDLPDPCEGLVKVGATGAACLMVHRNVYAAMHQQFKETPDGRPNPYPWFAEGLTTSKGAPLGEDIAFCRKAMIMGIPIHVALDIQIGHRKAGTLNVDTFTKYREGMVTQELV